MHKLLTIKPSVIFKNANTILENTINFIEKDNDFIYEHKIHGYMQFNVGAASYNFDSINEMNEAIAQENLDDLYIWSFNIDIKRHPLDREYPNNTILGVGLSIKDFNRACIEINGINFTKCNEFINLIANTLKCTIYIPEKTDSVEEARVKFNKDRLNGIKKCVQIFKNFPELQARITKELDSEKDVQDFIYPILKSHFRDLQEEDYTPKMGKVASKPDFCIKSLGIAIEIKFINSSKTFKKLTEEINDDSRKYFVKGSPYSKMIVFIYNGASKPTPANFVSDLENIEEIASVIISPNIIPD